MTDIAIRDAFEVHDRVYLERLLLATNVLVQAGEDPGTLNDIFQTELFHFRDRIERALLLKPGTAD